MTRLALAIALAALALAGCARGPVTAPAAPAPVASAPTVVAPATAPADSAPIVVAAALALTPFERALRDSGLDFRPPPTGKAILVNIPAYELIAFEDGQPVMTSRVIVGSPRNPTPVLDTEVSVVRFRPTWRPTPDMIASGEYADKVWPPGPKNPLGLAAIRLEPGLLVYLHDTNRRALFAKENRAMSHGCVRTEKWDELAAWILDIPLDRVLAHANGSRSFDMGPNDLVPVFIRYYTEFPDLDGTMRSFPDIYRRAPPPLARLADASDRAAPRSGPAG